MKKSALYLLLIFAASLLLGACQREAYQYYGKTNKRQAKKKWQHYNSLQYQ